MALLTTGLTAREWGNEGLSEEGVHSTTQIWMNIFVFKIFMSFLLLNLQHSHQIPPLKSTVKTLNPSIFLLSPYCCSDKLSIFHEGQVVLSSCPMTPQYVFQGWWMRNWEAMALNILYGNTAPASIQTPYTASPLSPPPVPRSINNGVRRRECAANRLWEREEKASSKGRRVLASLQIETVGAVNGWGNRKTKGGRHET